ncbi:MAG TPA: GntR family transcriptional regulator [Geminicoccus sp.]|jgi:DNA-binding GntR family transcriptional regulator|uniref:GntR family transcriptional regulator n=1 Tax=Geminicoccus sp. TaxID=2024832 RepID=UPI002E364E97|nr:GntR family transcriptional regulator [Geminicoccus sp.]HEX2529664.1 GntR family transcriptional regulator [Geminicoccus sp.]
MVAAEVTPIDRPEQLTDLVLARLRQDIVEGTFELGERLSEQQLSTRYRVTKAPIRSACIRLQGEGLLKIVPQRGIFVFDPTAAEVRALCELRAALELEAVALALERNRQDLARDLQAVIELMRPFALDPATVADLGYQRLDSAFHLAILQAASSPMLMDAYRTTVDWRFSALRTRLARQRAHAENSFREHLDIQAAVAGGDLPALQGLLRRHIDNTDRYYARLLQARAAAAEPAA